MWLSRVAWVVVTCMVGLVGVASLVGNPGPFVLTALPLGGLLGIVVRRHRELWCLPLAGAAFFLPLLLLISYGSSEGGISKMSEIVSATIILGPFAYGLAWFGMWIAQQLWSSEAPAAGSTDTPGR